MDQRRLDAPKILGGAPMGPREIPVKSDVVRFVMLFVYFYFVISYYNLLLLHYSESNCSIIGTVRITNSRRERRSTNSSSYSRREKLPRSRLSFFFFHKLHTKYLQASEFVKVHVDCCKQKGMTIARHNFEAYCTLLLSIEHYFYCNRT